MIDIGRIYATEDCSVILYIRPDGKNSIQLFSLHDDAVQVARATSIAYPSWLVAVVRPTGEISYWEKGIRVRP